MPLFLECTNEQKILVTCTPTTAAGRPAPIDGQLVARPISGPSTSAPGPDANSVWLISADDPGDTTYVIEADVDMEDGVVLVQDTATMTVKGAMASNLGLVAGTPELK